MGAIMADVKGKADGTLVSKIVKEELSNSPSFLILVFIAGSFFL